MVASRSWMGTIGGLVGLGGCRGGLVAVLAVAVAGIDIDAGLLRGNLVVVVVVEEEEVVAAAGAACSDIRRTSSGLPVEGP